VPLKVIIFEGNWARVPTKGKEQSSAVPARKRTTTNVVRAEVGWLELVFMEC